MRLTEFCGRSELRSKLRSRLQKSRHSGFAQHETLRVQWAQSVPASVLAKTVGGVAFMSCESVVMDHGALARFFHWDETLADEAHHLKKVDCKLMRALCKAVCLTLPIVTGTPVQNCLGGTVDT
ncbi:hypothetical protein LSCM1_01540 [Leishmania martiniquensis]|uniref:SNF2 N-terminal domain-containing protein n=1 Tax=Leishmania martiniquensis TaxID=1580590 RepID=A0A836GAS9_9TRYP|nr:hypothetical protein LSCM1_01540 [Leishmania martiniquensis]